MRFCQWAERKTRVSISILEKRHNTGKGSDPRITRIRQGIFQFIQNPFNNGTTPESRSTQWPSAREENPTPLGFPRLYSEPMKEQQYFTVELGVIKGPTDGITEALTYPTAPTFQEALRQAQEWIRLKGNHTAAITLEGRILLEANPHPQGMEVVHVKPDHRGEVKEFISLRHKETGGSPGVFLRDGV